MVHHLGTNWKSIQFPIGIHKVGLESRDAWGRYPKSHSNFYKSSKQNPTNSQSLNGWYLPSIRTRKPHNLRFLGNFFYIASETRYLNITPCDIGLGSGVVSPPPQIAQQIKFWYISEHSLALMAENLQESVQGCTPPKNNIDPEHASLQKGETSTHTTNFRVPW